MKPSPDEAPEGVCGQCGRPCGAVLVDVGIGAYEYAGARGYDERWVWSSDCCDAPIEDPPEVHCAECDRVLTDAEVDADRDICFACLRQGREPLI